MANIRVDLDYTIKDGSSIVFRSPCDCTQITGLVVYYKAEGGAEASQVFALADAHGENVGDIPHLFAENVVVKVILDVTSGMAFVQNADTNAYLEARFAELLPKTELPTAINAALAQAKATGEFDGADGQRGTGLLAVTTAPSSYTTAVGGITPKYRMALSTIKTQAGVKEVLLGDTVRYSYYHYPIAYLDASYAYFATRVSIRGATGTSVTVESVSESTVDEGSNVVTFSDGKALTVKNGKRGSAGKTPVRGVDYWTPTDRQQIKQELTEAMVTQEAGESETLVMSQKAVTALVNEALGESETTEYETVDSVDEMTDTSKQYVLSTTGTLWTYGEVTVEKEPENVFVPANAILNKRLGTSSESSKNGHYITEYLEFDGSTASSPIVWLPLNYDPTITDQRIWYCDASKTRLGNIYANNMIAPTDQVYIGQGKDGRYYFDLSKDGSGNTTGFSKHYPSMKYLRISLSSGKTTAITVSDIADVEILFEKDRGTATENQWYDTGLTPSASGGGGNWVDVIVKVNENKSNIAELNSRVIALENGNETLTIPAFWQDAVAACIAKIKALQVGKNCVTFPFFSDNHQRNGYAGLLIAHVMKECHIPYCFYGGDSISNGTIANEAEMIAQDKAFDTIMAYIPNGRLCRAVGNHDGYWYDGTNKYYYNRNQVYELFLREEAVAQNKYFGDDGTYYYVEDIASKVRFIVLNTNGGSVDDTQIAWFCDVALKVDEGWVVVVISHQPISNHYHANISNAAAVRSAAAESGVEIIGWFSGHIHRDRIYAGAAVNATDDSEGSDMGFKQVVITSDHTGIAYDDATKHTVANDDQSHAIDFVTINRSTRTVNLTRLGIGSDRSYNY